MWKRIVCEILGGLFIIGLVVFNVDSFSDYNLNNTAQKRNAYASQASTRHADFDEFYTQRKVNSIELHQENIGRIFIKSGKLLACDPLFMEAEFTEPFSRIIAPGSYPVILCIANLEYWGEKIAFAKIVFKNEDVTRWELAKVKSSNLDDHFYGVDSGMGCFVDQESGLQFSKLMKDYEKIHEGDYYTNYLKKEFKVHKLWDVHFPFKNQKNNIIMFYTGLGQGGYASYWGLNNKNEVVSLVTDFQLFDSNGYYIIE